VQINATVVLVLGAWGEEFHAKPPFVGFAKGTPPAPGPEALMSIKAL